MEEKKEFKVATRCSTKDSLLPPPRRRPIGRLPRFLRPAAGPTIETLFADCPPSALLCSAAASRQIAVINGTKVAVCSSGASDELRQAGGVACHIKKRERGKKASSYKPIKSCVPICFIWAQAGFFFFLFFHISGRFIGRCVRAPSHWLSPGAMLKASLPEEAFLNLFPQFFKTS